MSRQPSDGSIDRTPRHGTDITVQPVVLACLAMAIAWVPAVARGETPFGVSARLIAASNESASVSVDFDIPTDHYLYADRMAIVPSDTDVVLRPAVTPEPIRHYDEMLEEEVAVYEQNMTFVFRVEPGSPAPSSLDVSYQGCSKKPMVCFLPQSLVVKLDGADGPSDRSVAETAGDNTGWESLAEQFSVASLAVGYLPSDKFLAFLDSASTGKGYAREDDALANVLRRHGIWLVVVMILLGGLALNLTPCVLPMIPVNLAIIGAGAQAGSRMRGLALGAAYGAGIAVVYGALGLVVVLTGATFGTLNASPWFNLAIALFFAVMALAMFGVIHVDFSRFQGSGSPSRKGSFVAAFAVGSVAALLAGACVAPVVISVLLLAADLNARGIRAGLLLPFVLGLGMALPWPFAGAGLSFLPKPGQWMERVKFLFGVVIVLFALWYGRLGLSLLGPRAVVPTVDEAPDAEDWFSSLEPGLAAGLREGKPVFIDFWATWCKNCVHMDKTTFQDLAVKTKLKDFVTIKYQAEQVSDPEVKRTLEHFGALGLPTYVILVPGKDGAAENLP